MIRTADDFAARQFVYVLPVSLTHTRVPFIGSPYYTFSNWWPDKVKVLLIMCNGLPSTPDSRFYPYEKTIIKTNLNLEWAMHLHP